MSKTYSVTHGMFSSFGHISVVCELIWSFFTGLPPIIWRGSHVWWFHAHSHISRVGGAWIEVILGRCAYVYIVNIVSFGSQYGELLLKPISWPPTPPNHFFKVLRNLFLAPVERSNHEGPYPCKALSQIGFSYL